MPCCVVFFIVITPTKAQISKYLPYLYVIVWQRDAVFIKTLESSATIAPYANIQVAWTIINSTKA
ncbi:MULTISPECIES: hypothetical protein [Helicobacter]|uniref:Uncharacterized protein n=1 Tax=Helicobacter typhlonius TaxID=76936 RepID=A0A0S4PZL8_9HELI|nr:MULTISPECIES: hypothetical protein [Helicobacter]TLD78196.1 hypothetical protein LS75_007005 [Helicobacter typhlonius]TLD86849.1 hypothetical protein LS67_007345 [Helicobacter sp. MIT 03-1616]CUU40670.1 Hypothetical protein BN2458_PEG1787 [Helicobacter typhlonius]